MWGDMKLFVGLFWVHPKSVIKLSSCVCCSSSCRNGGNDTAQLSGFVVNRDEKQFSTSNYRAMHRGIFNTFLSPYFSLVQYYWASFSTFVLCFPAIYVSLQISCAHPSLPILHLDTIRLHDLKFAILPAACRRRIKPVKFSPCGPLTSNCPASNRNPEVYRDSHSRF